MEQAQAIGSANDNVVATDVTHLAHGSAASVAESAAGGQAGPDPIADGNADSDDAIAALLPHGPVELAAEGGMARVYQGYDAARGCPVAIKVLRRSLLRNAEIVAAFEAEHTLVSRIAHPAVVAYHGSGRAGGVPYLVMDWCEGQTLADIVAFEPMPLRRVAVVGAQLASALAAAHEACVVHCDLKPDNVIVAKRTGEIRLLDFGVARRSDLPAVESDVVSGTPSYMAPEQWMGAPVPASDIYSLGCVLYELVTGAPPFHGNFGELMSAHRHQAPTPVGELRPDLSAGLASLIMAMLAKEPEARPSAATVASRLTALRAPRRTVAAGHTLASSAPAAAMAS
jgi:eukaryotic-like serine/threonine-protein kinase